MLWTHMVPFWNTSAPLSWQSMWLKLRGNFLQNICGLCLYLALPSFCCLGFVAPCVQKFCVPVGSFDMSCWSFLDLISWLSRLFPCFSYLPTQLSLSFSRLLLKQQISKCTKNTLVGLIAPLAHYYVQLSCGQWNWFCHQRSSGIKMRVLSHSLRKEETRTCGYLFSRAIQRSQWKI